MALCGGTWGGEGIGIASAFWVPVRSVQKTSAGLGVKEEFGGRGIARWQRKLSNVRGERCESLFVVTRELQPQPDQQVDSTAKLNRSA